MKTFEGCVHDNRRQIRMFFLAMPLVLLIQMQIFARLLIVSDQILKTGIIHLARGNQYLHQGLFLCPSWSQSVFKRFHTQSIASCDYIVKYQIARDKASTHLTPWVPHHRGLRRAKALYCQKAYGVGVGVPLPFPLFVVKPLCCRTSLSSI